MRDYVFYRDDMFYLAPCTDDQMAIDCVPLNPGTRRVEDLTGRKVWPLPLESVGDELP